MFAKFGTCTSSFAIQQKMNLTLLQQQGISLEQQLTCQSIVTRIPLAALRIFISSELDGFKLWINELMTLILLITYTSVIPLLFVFVFGNCAGSGPTTTRTASLATVFCDETVIKLRIRIAILILILVNDCAASRDTTSRIVIRLIIVIDIIDNKARIIFDGTFNILILTEILMAILSVDDLLQVLLKINPVILVTFVFDDSTANIDITKHSTLFTIMFCDKVFNAMCIRIALEISINSCKEPCDSPLRIVTKCIRLNDMIDSPISTGIILHNVVDIGIEMELILIVFIAYWLDGTIQSTIPILWLIDAIVYLTALIFGTANSISPGKAQNKIKKQS